MVGIFDSGLGGAYSLFEFRKMCPSVPVCFFGDKSNAPYGTKDESELVLLVGRGIRELMNMGASRVLLACCTASTVHHLLPDELSNYSIPIIDPIAEEAVRVTRSGSIGVISTAATARSGAFAKSIERLLPGAQVTSVAAPELVTLAELGKFGERMDGKARKIIENAISPLACSGIDTLILGCTHFSYFEREIEDIMRLPVINSAREGAGALLRHIERGV